MKIILVILLLSLSVVACPQVIRTLYGRITNGSQGVGLMRLHLAGASSQFSTVTTQLGYYRLEASGCDVDFVFSGTSKRYQFAQDIKLTFMRPEQELNIVVQ